MNWNHLFGSDDGRTMYLHSNTSCKRPTFEPSRKLHNQNALPALLTYLLHSVSHNRWKLVKSSKVFSQRASYMQKRCGKVVWAHPLHSTFTFSTPQGL